MRKLSLMGSVVCVGVAAGMFWSCKSSTDNPPAAKTAKALLKDKTGASFGTVTFTAQSDGKVKLDINLVPTSTLASPGDHAIHIHAGSSCEPPAFTTAMGHWDPTTMMHGNPASSPHHSGDLGNVTLDSAMKGTKTMTSGEMSLTTGQANSILNLAVIVHRAQDDFTSQPAGNSGARIACGIITLQ